MLNPRIELLNDYPFRRLADLIADVTPRTNAPPVLMHVGEPRHEPPAFVAELIAANASSWNRYPPLAGTPELREACARWVERRAGLPTGTIDPQSQICAVAGSREGLYMAAFLAAATKGDGRAALALMPNPFYQVYVAAAAMAGLEPALLATSKATGFLPDLDAIPESILSRAALFYLCSPSNPQGVVASRAYLARAVELARRHDFLLVADECYAEIYTTPTPPASVIDAAGLPGGSLDNIVVFHTLSKRSSVPGLRSGFALSSAATMKRFIQMITYGGAGLPLPVQAASTALWSDEAHVLDNRKLYQAKFALATRLIGERLGFHRPDGGFYLWLDVGDGEAAARRLWAEAGVKVLPGRYLTRPDAAGVNGGDRFIRVALVHDLETTEDALRRLARTL